MIRRVVRAAREGGCVRVAVVVGEAGPEIAAALRETAAEILPHPDWARGLGSSIKRGVEHFAETEQRPAALLLLACDQPFVDAKLIAALIKRWEETGAEVVASRYAETLGIPALFDHACFDDLLALPDKSGAKSLLEDARRVVAEVLFPEGEMDIDTPGDIARLRSGGTGAALS